MEKFENHQRRRRKRLEGAEGGEEEKLKKESEKGKENHKQEWRYGRTVDDSDFNVEKEN